jgi:hypothetical protein
MALGDIVDFLMSDEARKLALACPPSAAVKALDTKADDLNQNWNPTGYYTADQMRQIVGATMNLVNQYHNSVMTARARHNINELADAEDTFNDIGRQAVDYTQTWQKAQASGAVVNAPGLKYWVVNSTRAMNKGMRAVEIASCTEPWWFGALATYTAMFDALAGVLKSIVGVLVKAGDIVLDAVETTFKLWPVLKWGAVSAAVLFAGVYVWNRLFYAAEAGRQPFNWSRLNPIAKLKQLKPPSRPVSGYRRRRR